MKSDLPYKQLHKILFYEPKTGVFNWIISRQSIRKGDVAGCINSDGYRIIRINGIGYKAHRLAWLYTYGYLPENFIDHINRNKSDNRIDNLREISHQCNLRNTGNPKDNKSGVKGVMLSNQTGKWISRVTVNNKQISLGHYNVFDNAVCARLAGEQCLNWSGCDSNSPAFQYVQKHITQRN